MEGYIYGDEIDRVLNAHLDKPVRVSNACLFNDAFTHKSICPQNSYERLEFLGDAVLSLAISSYLYKRYPSENEGFMTRVRSKIVSGSFIGGLCSAHTTFADFVSRKCAFYNSQKNVVSLNVLEDVFEAFLGATFIEFGFEVASRWTVSFLEVHVDFAAVVAGQYNVKDELNKHMIKYYKYAPVFDVKKGPTKTTTAKIRDTQGNLIAVGQGCNRVDAERNASINALSYMGVNTASFR